MTALTTKRTSKKSLVLPIGKPGNRTLAQTRRIVKRVEARLSDTQPPTQKHYHGMEWFFSETGEPLGEWETKNGRDYYLVEKSTDSEYWGTTESDLQIKAICDIAVAMAERGQGKWAKMTIEENIRTLLDNKEKELYQSSSHKSVSWLRKHEDTICLFIGSLVFGSWVGIVLALVIYGRSR